MTFKVLQKVVILLVLAKKAVIFLCLMGEWKSVRVDFFRFKFWIRWIGIGRRGLDMGLAEATNKKPKLTNFWYLQNRHQVLDFESKFDALWFLQFCRHNFWVGIFDLPCEIRRWKDEHSEQNWCWWEDLMIWRRMAVKFLWHTKQDKIDWAMFDDAWMMNLVFSQEIIYEWMVEFWVMLIIN